MSAEKVSPNEIRVWHWSLTRGMSTSLPYRWCLWSVWACHSTKHEVCCHRHKLTQYMLSAFKLYYYAIYCVIKLCKLSMLTNAHTCSYQGYNILDTAWIRRFWLLLFYCIVHHFVLVVACIFHVLDWENRLSLSQMHIWCSMVQTFTEFGSIWKFSLDIVCCLLRTQMKENAALQNKQLLSMSQQ